MRPLLRGAAALAVAATLLLAPPATAEPPTPEGALRALFSAEAVDADRFTDRFLAQVPAAQVAQIIGEMKRSHGALVGVDAVGKGEFTLRFGQAEVPARIVLDGGGRIAGLWFGLPLGDIGTQVAAIRALPGRASVLVRTSGKVVAAHAAEAPLAVGSAAKLAVLVALKGAVAEKRLAWDAVVALDPRWKSLPSGQLQDWPDGTPVTIATLAHLMISISDNTATDALVRLVGREAVEAVTPRNAPFPTTRELFVLKAKGNAALRREWQTGDAARRRAILGRIADAPLGPVSEEVTHEAEWFMTATELCDLLDAAAGLPSVGIRPGPADPRLWRRVAFKGGSEVGVLNLSSRLEGRDGAVHCLVATWNGDGALDQDRLLRPYRSLIDLLARHKG